MRDRRIELCEAIDALRKELPLGAEAPFSGRAVARIAEALRDFDDLPVVRVFVEDCQAAQRRAPDFRRTRQAVTEADDGLILGLFAASYNPRLGLDCIVARRAEVDPALASRYPHDGVRPIVVDGATEGFRFGLSVALFAENFVTTEPPGPEHKAYYFVDRFVRRFWEITRPILMLCSTPRTLARLKAATRQEVAKAATAWVYLHEFFHRAGFLPLPTYLELKSSRLTAGLEEVRCDVLSVISTFKEARASLELGELYAQFILAERLIRYPLQDEPKRNYDAIGAQFLFGFLRQRGVIGDDDGTLDFTRPFSEVIDALREMAVGINKIEHAIRNGDNKEAALERRKGIVRKLGGFDDPSRSFTVLPFYARMRDQAKRAKIGLEMRY